MTDQTPANEAGPAKVSLMWAWFAAHPEQPMKEGQREVEVMFEAIEAEARADALREAADAVRALPQCDCGHNNGAVLAILDPQP